MYKNILLPVAFDHDHMPEKALEAARILASPGARVTILHVMEETPAFAIYRMPDEDLHNLREAVQIELDQMASGFENGEGVLIDGHSGRTILEWAKENEPDCIILSSHRPGLQDYLLGSTAEHVVRHAQCSVHVIR